MPNAYPTVDDLQERLEEAGITLSTSNAQSQISAAIAYWESQTYAPFLANESDEPVTFNAEYLESGVVLFKRGMVSSEAISVAYGAFTWTEGPLNNYVLRREWQNDLTGPYTWAKVNGTVTWVPFNWEQYVQVTGIAGYGFSIPDDVWEGIVDMALMRTLPWGAMSSSVNPLGLFRRIAIGNQDQDVTFATDGTAAVRGVLQQGIKQLTNRYAVSAI